MYDSVVRNYIGNLVADEALTPSAPTARTPSPFDDDTRMDIGFQKFGKPIQPFDESPTRGDVFNIQGTRGPDDPKPYAGPLDVSRIYREQGAVLPEQGFFDKAFGSKPTIDKITGRVSYGMPRGMSPFLGPLSIFAQLGSAGSRMNLENIYEKVQAGEEGYGLALFNGRVVGVRPGQLPSGNLPPNLSTEQLRELKKNILAAGAPTDEPAPPKPSFEEQVAQYFVASGESPDGSYSLVSGGERNIVQDDAGRPVTTTGDKPVTTSAGQYVDPALLQAQADAMTAAAQEDKAPTQSAPAPAPKPDPIDQNLYGDKGGDGDRGGDRGGSGQAGTGSGPGERFRASGGTVGFAEGGNTQKDPIQRTGFVEGPPQEYAKGTTVADTENLRVREGSFVINAPMTEKLQKAGVLPKGNQKRKAAKGGKMMEVALSKGEYVVEPKDVPKFGGYGFLEAVNDMGKPEVERRQAMRNGGEAGIDIPPLSRGFAQKPAFRSVPEGFVQQEKVDPGPIPPVQINNINLQNVRKALELVETRGFENLNEGYFYTRSDTPQDPSSAFGPLQITDETVLAMIKEFDDLRIQMELDPEFAQYITEYNTAGRNRVNMREHNKIYEGERGKKSVGRKPTPEEAIIYKNLGTGPISVERHKEHYPLLGELYLRYKAGMSDSEEDLVRRHFGNNKSLKKFKNAKKELGID
tara:strand:- start:1081 stop:3153 length:2073 start_codon:yes stop_codon:yes gene_type:complete